MTYFYLLIAVIIAVCALLCLNEQSGGGAVGAPFSLKDYATSLEIKEGENLAYLVDEDGALGDYAKLS